MRLTAAALLFTTVMAQSGDLKTSVSSWVDTHQKEIVGELLEALAIPNVAADQPNIRRNAEHLRTMLGRRGFVVEILETTGNPLVYGSLNVPGATRPVLFYCPYDGEPVDVKAWKQPDPFTPVLRRGRMEDQPAALDPTSI